MPSIDPKTHAAIAKAAALLAPNVTTEFIHDVARQRGLRDIGGTNKAAKLTDVFWQLAGDRRRRFDKLGDAIMQVVAESYARTLRGTGDASLDAERLEGVAGAMRSLGLDPQELRHYGWRAAAAPKKDASAPGVPATVLPAQEPLGCRYEQALLLLGEMAVWAPSQAGERGRKLELIILEVLQREKLEPRHSIRNPGEQVDFTFSLGGVTGLIECAWEARPIGLPKLHEIKSKVGVRFVGTFGVFISMSDFTKDVNEHIARGERLNTIGLGSTDMMSVLEGRTTFTERVRRGRRAAADDFRFCR